MTTFDIVNASGAIVRQFARKSDATRYANKHGMVVSQYDATTTLALIASLDSDETDSVIASLDTDAVSFHDAALSFDAVSVAAMQADIVASFARRDVFESNAASDLSYTRERARMLEASAPVARFFLALNVSPSSVIERKVNSSNMFNAKALKKIVELARFACGTSNKVEKVMLAFIACALTFDAKLNGAIANKVNKSFLSGLNFDKIVSDTELADYLSEYQHKYMSGGKDTQSSQARNVLDVLGLGRIVTCDNANRGGIEINSNHLFFAQFRTAFMH